MEDKKNMVPAADDNKSYKVTQFFELFRNLSPEDQTKALCFIQGMVQASGCDNK